MKTLATLILVAVLAGWLSTGFAQTTIPAAPASPAALANAAQQENKKDDQADQAKAVPAAPAKTAVVAQPKPGDGLRLNFRGVPLDMVLNYLSEAAGFTIVLEAAMKGTVDVWSSQPLSKDEAVDLLNQVLNKNGFAAIRNNRTLTIVTREEAKKRDIPVKSGFNPQEIPKNDEIVTQIIPVRYINATQLTKDLEPLLPTTANMTANESGNALVITDTQTNIRRMAEIINALDTSVSSISSIKVFALRYADAKDLAATVKELFQTDASSQGVGSRTRGGFPGGGPAAFLFGGGAPGGDRGSSRTSGGGGSGGRAGAGKVAAVADERSNSLVVAAPDDIMPTIEQLIKEVDTDVQDITELRVFRLKHADPIEMAELLTNLFPDETKTGGNTSGSFGSRFGSPFGGGIPGVPSRTSGSRSSSGGNLSERDKKQGRVTAVPDARTASVIVTASRDMMKQIEAMVTQLDSDPARKQKVFIYSLENADVQQVESVLQSLFQSQNNRNTTRSGASQNSPLTSRQQQQSQSGSSSRNSGLGGGAGGGLGGGTSGGIGGIGR